MLATESSPRLLEFTSYRNSLGNVLIRSADDNAAAHLYDHDGVPHRVVVLLNTTTHRLLVSVRHNEDWHKINLPVQAQSDSLCGGPSTHRVSIIDDATIEVIGPPDFYIDHARLLAERIQMCYPQITKAGDRWRIKPNETYPQGWEATVEKVVPPTHTDDLEESLVFWEDGTHTKLRDLKHQGWEKL